MAEEFEFYRDLSKRERDYDAGSVELGDMRGSRLSEGYERAQQSSVSSERVQPTPRKKTKTIKITKPLAILAAVAIVVTSSLVTLGVTKGVEEVQETMAISEFCDDIGVNDALREASWGQNTKDGYIYGYNQNTLADYVSSHENPDMAVFALYSRISMEKTSNMSEIVSRAFDDCSSWDDYLSKKGFVDKDGNPSNDVYKNVMTELVKADQTMEKVEQSHGIKR